MPDAVISIETIETSGLGDRSYVVHDGTVALVVDPQRDLDRVEAVLDRTGVRLTHVLETHVHNDYVSGGPVLAWAHGADYVGHADDDVFMDRHGVRDGDTLTVGAMTVRVVAAPGHTPTHLAYVVADGQRDVAVFTGGSLLYGSVGRTDLVSRHLTEQLTRDQHATVNQLAADLAADVEVRPTHGFGSFCSSISPDDADSGSSEVSTIGEQRDVNVALRTDLDDFVEQLLAGLDDYPRYYVHMGPRNRLGAEPVDLSPPVEADPTELRARIHAGEWVVDLRDRTAFAADHVRGTINVELAGSFVTYVGWLVPWNLPLTLLGDTPEQVADAQRELVRIGIDRPAAGADGGIGSWGGDLDRGRYRVADFAALAAARADGDGDGPLVLDARRRLEWADGHVDGAMHLPLHELPRRVDEVPDDREVWVHCASGYRASIAASLLARAGRNVVLVDDEVGHARKAGLEWVGD